MCKLMVNRLTIFLHFLVAMDMWYMVLGLFRVSWVMPQLLIKKKKSGVMPQSVLGLRACWQGRFGRHRNGHI